MGLFSGKENGTTILQKLTGKKDVRMRRDGNFPLNMRILSRVSLDLTHYYLAEDQLLMGTPVSTGTIEKIGTIERGGGLVDYMARISPDTVEELETFLFVETQDKKVLSTKIFTTGAKIYPGSADEWDFWLDPETGILSNEVLNTPDDGPSFSRYWGEGSQVAPLHACEALLCDQYGDHTNSTLLAQMMFARVVRDANEKDLTEEYALVSVVNETHIEVLYGVATTLTDGQIIGA